jgi:LAO/AO transport system kinase
LNTDVAALCEGVLAGQRAEIGQAITLVESRQPDHFPAASELLALLAPHAGAAQRIGLTGVPGVGKSTFIERFGLNLIEQGHRVAVLAVDPTSSRTGGSILGDKTRMERLSRHESAFIRPSPAGTTLGGVAARSREAMLICEAAGFDVVIVETVGVGQSEWAVSQMTDVFVLLLLAGAGDELQGIKRGIMELADIVVINKADGPGEAAAKRAVQTFSSALHMLHSHDAVWLPRVHAASALTGAGIDETWSLIGEHRAALQAEGLIEVRRADQRVRWMWDSVEDLLASRLRAERESQDLEAQVRAGTVPPTAAARQLLDD